MHNGFCLSMAALLASLSGACTFYTSCPPTDSGGSNSGAGGTGGGGGGTSPAGGAVSGNWVSVTSNLADLSSECGNMAFLSAKPDEDRLIAGISLNGLWSSQDGGESWEALGTGPDSDTIVNRPSSIVYDPEDSQRYWESGLYNGLGIHETQDNGDTFKALGTLAHSDLVSVDFSDPERSTLLAGGHEMSQTLSRSTDGGSNWESIADGLPENTNCTTPLIIDSRTYLVGCGGYGGGVTGVYRSTNSGRTWLSMTTSGGASPPLVASDKSIYWASATGGMTRSTDNGETWTDIGKGIVRNTSPIELAEGKIAALGGNAVVVSSDNGETWHEVSPPLPYNDASGLAYSAQQKALYVWHFTCGAPPVRVPADAIMMFPFDATSI